MSKPTQKNGFKGKSTVGWQYRKPFWKHHQKCWSSCRFQLWDLVSTSGDQLWGKLRGRKGLWPEMGPCDYTFLAKMMKQNARFELFCMILPHVFQTTPHRLTTFSHGLLKRLASSFSFFLARIQRKVKVLPWCYLWSIPFVLELLVKHPFRMTKSAMKHPFWPLFLAWIVWIPWFFWWNAHREGPAVMCWLLHLVDIHHKPNGSHSFA